ncbi:MAG: hypothetical protein QXT84_02060, partial [Candidatus Bathyarchaeia archaeon]
MGKRYPHYLKSNSRSVYPREIVFFDTESRPVQIDETFQELRFWFGYAEYVSKDRTGCYQVKKSLVFNTADAFADFLEKLVRNRKTLYVMAHNIQHDLLTMKL